MYEYDFHINASYFGIYTFIFVFYSIESIKTKVVSYTEDEFVAESKKRNEKRNANNPAHGEDGHVHDENCGHNH